MSRLIVAAAVIEHEGKILLTRRMAHVPYPLLWEFPGGKVEPGEDPKVCVVREISEELAIAVTVTGIYEVIFYRYPEHDVLMLAYRCRWMSGNVKNLEVSEHCWASPADIVNFELLPADISLAERIAREFGSEYPACI